MGNILPMNRFKLTTRLSLLVGLLIFFLIITGFFGVFTARNSNSKMEDVYNSRILAVKELKHVSDLYGINIIETVHKIYNNELSWTQGLFNLTEARNNINYHWRNYVDRDRSKEELKRIQICEDLISQGDEELLKLRSILRTRDIFKLENFINTDLYSRVTPINEAINDLINIQLVEAEKSIAEGRKLFFILSISLIVSLFLSILLGSYISYIIIRDLAKSIKTVNIALNAIGTGDLTGKIKLTSRDEVSEIGNNINITVKNIRDLISSILEQTEKLMGIGTKLQNNIDDTAESISHIDKNIHLIDKRISLQRNSVLGIKKSINSLKLAEKDLELICGTNLDIPTIVQEKLVLINQKLNKITDDIIHENTKMEVVSKGVFSSITEITREAEEITSRIISIKDMSVTHKNELGQLIERVHIFNVE